MGVQKFRVGAGTRTAALAVAILAAFTAQPAKAACGDHPAAGIDWTKCDKVRLVLSGEDLSGGTFEQTFFTSSDLRKSNLSGSKLVRAEMSMASFAGADLSGADMQKAMANRTDFSGANLANANLAGAEFSRANFTGAVLTGVVFANSEMNRSIFDDADLTGADMSKAELARVRFKGAKIGGVSFRFSNLSRASFTGVEVGAADFGGAYLFLTRFEDVDLSAAQGLTPAQLANSCGSEKTKLPPGLPAGGFLKCAPDDDE